MAWQQSAHGDWQQSANSGRLRAAPSGQAGIKVSIENQ
jgi:hypothetical protein